MEQLYNIYEVKGQTLKSHIRFELISWYGRNFRKNKNRIDVKNHQTPLLLDLGCGLNYTEGWINADFYRSPRFKFWKKYKKRSKLDLELDLRYRINCPDNVIDGVYSGHLLEHLSPADALNLLQNIFRILKPNAWLRINVPDLEKFVDFYTNKSKAVEFNQFNTACEAIGSLTQDYGHISVWDFEFLSNTLSKVGFTNINSVKFGEEGRDERLVKEEKVRAWSTLVIEAQKPD